MDEGLYDVNLAIDGCLSNYSLFQLEISDCDANNPPHSDPLTFNPVVAEPIPGELYCINVTLNEDNDTNDYEIRWLISGEDVCPNMNLYQRYNCTRENILRCTAVAGLCVEGLTSNDSGEIQVQPFPVNSGGTMGNNAVIKFGK